MATGIFFGNTSAGVVKPNNTPIEKPILSSMDRIEHLQHAYSFIEILFIVDHLYKFFHSHIITLSGYRLPP